MVGGGWWRQHAHGRSPGEDWEDFHKRLKRVEAQLEHSDYQSVFNPVSDHQTQLSYGFFTASHADGGRLALKQLNDILSSKYLGSPHGQQIFKPVDAPELPDLPPAPTTDPGSWAFVAEHLERIREKLQKKREAFTAIAAKDKEMLAALERGYGQSEPKYVEFLASLSLVRHHLPKALFRPCETHYDPVGRVILCDLQIPSFASLSIVKQRANTQKWVPLSPTERKKAYETILYSLCIRTAYLIAKSDIGEKFDAVAVNARQQWFDTATGASREGAVASLHAMKRDLSLLQLDRVDPKDCFRHLKGVATPSVDQIAPIRPIFIMDTYDRRIVKGRDVDANLEAEANLAAMPWEDFEHLVRQLFEWEFGRNGVEVKVTRASRDRGVDAIMFDPDPLRGGKYVLQAKRYTRTVDVSSVRDLYGTILNEGANRGVLVTTSGFGPDAYEFAKDKPISLVDGPHLMEMLRRHGRKYRIDLAEARRLGADMND